MGIGEVLGLIAVGAVIGVLARVVMPGRQSLSVLATVVLGVLGTLVGYWAADRLLTGSGGTIVGLRWIIGVAAAILLTFVYETFLHRSVN
ncbi:GlsB/YeaQ/YmgE family stress response membrane protein [Gordonia sp. (in: high G+C Gram-positive bacteria)]|uniref:GlsB/YeaQ/YmgE family stress response membrane protein n=1 Tax=Gordonia sp. (in: high G+C Gram-positive bacteria) TaxID=84139 RepID=UPI0039E41F9B